MTRAYHNPYVREGQWTRMFDRRLPAVVPMDHKYLAKHDGSEMASGRGSGLDKGALHTGIGDGDIRGQQQRVQKTPYMHMTFHPLERRLDTAIWRALFASSAKQARQFVVHGWVKVNGKKMVYPGYQLNPGDMFQVEPERVMYATGARKKERSSHLSDDEEELEWVEDGSPSTESGTAINAETEGVEEEFADESEADAAKLNSSEDGKAESTEPDEMKDAKKALKNLVARAKLIMEDGKRQLSGKRQQELREFARSVRTTISKHGRGGAEGGESMTNSVADLEVALAEIMAKVPDDALPTQSTSKQLADDVEKGISSSNPQARDRNRTDAYNARKDAELLWAALERARANPIDASKPYATPWKPRPFMSAFAFIPRYLEVNQRICSAVYLRHPVARPGLAEVPTPFHAETMGLAFNWYLRRR